MLEGMSAGENGSDDVAEAERIPDPPRRQTPLWALLSKWLLATEAWLRSHGGRGLRNSIRVFWGLVGAVGIFLLVGPVISPPLSLDDITESAGKATDTWIAREFAADYDIERTDEGRLVAHVEERITAFFPDDVDEPGIRRILATQYEGHALAPSNITATVDGVPAMMAQGESADRLTLTLTPPDAQGSLRGDHEFVLAYDLHDLAYLTTDDATGQPVDLLEWDVLGPDWGHALAGIDVSITLPEDVDDALVRQPRGSLGWLLVGGGEWLTPEPDAAAGTVAYRFTNEQNIPPYAQARFRLPFTAGTFTMPPRSALFWVQVYGPLAPLAILVVTLLFALAARAVAWSDARGRPWFVAQYTRPADTSVGQAAQILRTPRTLALGRALEALRLGRPARSGRGRRAATSRAAEGLTSIARTAARTGRAGDLPRALSEYLAAPERKSQIKGGLRRVPRGFVRDLFLAAPLALTAVQWGLIRQLSHQTILAIVWWPVAFVLLSSAISAVILWIALTSRPLTRKGALIKQHLRGIEAYARQTHLLERGPITDPVLPYAVLTASPRNAGERVLALAEAQLGSKDASRGWRDRSFITWPQILVRLASVLAILATVAAVILLAPPYPRGYDYASYYGDVKGTIHTKVESFEAIAELTRTDDGSAQLSVVEDLTVSFGDEGSRVPQFAQQWPNERNGQRLGLRVETVQIDGRDVPFTTRQDGDTLLMATQLVEVLSGPHHVRITYALDSAATAAEPVSRSDHDGRVDAVRWAALLEGWEHDTGWGSDPAPDPLHVELRMSEELAAVVLDGGWLTEDTDSAEHARDWAEDVVPFGDVARGEVYDAEESTETTKTIDGVRRHVLELKQNESGGWPFYLTVDDVGARVDFPAGTFTGTDAAALDRRAWDQVSPIATVLALGILTLLLGLFGLFARALRPESMALRGSRRDLVRWLAPALGLSTVILFVWMSGDMPADWPELLPLGLGAIAGVVGAVLALIATRGPRRPAPSASQ